MAQVSLARSRGVSAKQELENIKTETSGKLWLRSSPDTAERFLQLPISPAEKYKWLDFARLITANAKSHDWGQKLLSVLNRLYNCGADLLKPSEQRSSNWRTFRYEDSEGKVDIRSIKGIQEILFMMGYTIEGKSGFSLHHLRPKDVQDIAGISAELYLAKAELESFLRGSHSWQYELSMLVQPAFRPKPDFARNNPLPSSPFSEENERSVRDDNDYLSKMFQHQFSTTETIGVLPEEEVRCELCQGINIYDAELCASCAGPLRCPIKKPTTLQRETMQPATQEISTEKTCQFCTYINPPEVTVCVMCSKTLADGAEAEDKEFTMQGACGGYTPVEVETDAEFQNGYEDQEETYNVRRCAACTYFNPFSRNTCQLCYSSLIGNGNEDEPEIAGDTQDPNNNANNEGAAGSKADAENHDLTSPKEKPRQISRKGSKKPIGTTERAENNELTSFEKNPGQNSKKGPKVVFGTTEKPENYKLTSSKNKPGVNSRNDPKVSINLQVNDTGDYFPKEKSRCHKCGSKCQTKLGPLEDRRCTSCDYRFCDACSSPFEKNCRRNRDCPKGAHCHHPRDCVVYLRNFKPKTLKQLLSSHKLDVKEYTDWMKMEAKRRKCSEKVIQAETSSESKNWLCKPYTEYLISIINKHNVDPAVIMSPEQLKTIIRRELDFEAPGTKGRALLELVQKNCPMRKIDRDSAVKRINIFGEID